MTAVKGSKQYKMVVVPHRPFYRAGIFCVFLAAVAAFSWLTYSYGMKLGLATKVEIVEEVQILTEQLEATGTLVADMRQEIAERKLGGQIDSRANEEVRQTIESLQDQIAELNEEIRFYKGVMLPNVEEKGLRIERIDMKASNDPNTFKFSLLLTQIVEKHEFVQGGVEIKLVGQETQLSLSELGNADRNPIRFRFRYFQNINGVLIIPDGFEPQQITIVAMLSGKDSQRLEKKFDWQLSGD